MEFRYLSGACQVSQSMLCDSSDLSVGRPLVVATFVVAQITEPSSASNARLRIAQTTKITGTLLIKSN